MHKLQITNNPTSTNIIPSLTLWGYFIFSKIRQYRPACF